MIAHNNIQNEKLKHKKALCKFLPGLFVFAAGKRRELISFYSGRGPIDDDDGIRFSPTADESAVTLTARLRPQWRRRATHSTARSSTGSSY
jgi:hypothetical protein